MNRDPSAAELRDAGGRILAWIEEYLSHPERYAVLARSRPGEIRDSLPASPPERGESLDAILRDFEEKVVPGVTHWNHPGFFGYFAISAPVAGILGELLIAALNVNGMLWRTSPAATELEEVTLDWLRQMLGIGEPRFGIICDTASISTMLGLAAARERSGADVRTRGMAGRTDLPRFRVYCSEHAHSSVDKGVLTLGMGTENLLKIPTDEAFRMRPDLLEQAITGDLALGFRPVACVATAGTTVTTSVDPLPEIARICATHDVWLHVDAAYAGAAAVVPELRPQLAGLELADSIVVNPHKWMFTPIDCSALLLRDGSALERAFSLVPDYLSTPGDHEATDLMNYGVQLGRRFRALKLWMVIRAFGTEGIAERIRTHVAMAQELGSWIAAEPGWEVSAPHPFSVVCFRRAGEGRTPEEQDADNQEILERVNASGEVFLSHARVGGRFVMRVAIGNVRTERAHIVRAWELLREAARHPGQGRSA